MKLTAHRRRAFTLTEVVITLGVLGVALGGIWWAASAVYFSMEANKVVKTVRELNESTRAFYGNRPPQNLAAGERFITQTLGLARAYPQELTFVNNTAIPNNSFFEPKANSLVYLSSVRLDAVRPSSLINIHRLTPEMCVRIATNLTRVPDNRMWGIWLNGAQYLFPDAPPSDENIDQQCFNPPNATCFFGQPCLIVGYWF